MAVCSEIHTKHINTVCGQNVELLNVKLAVHIVTTRLSPRDCAIIFQPIYTKTYISPVHFAVSCATFRCGALFRNFVNSNVMLYKVETLLRPGVAQSGFRLCYGLDG